MILFLNSINHIWIHLFSLEVNNFKPHQVTYVGLNPLRTNLNSFGVQTEHC